MLEGAGNDTYESPHVLEQRQDQFKGRLPPGHLLGQTALGVADVLQVWTPSPLRWQVITVMKE